MAQIHNLLLIKELELNNNKKIKTSSDITHTWLTIKTPEQH